MLQIFKAYKTIWRVLKGKERFYFVLIFLLCCLRAFSYLGLAQVIACLTAKALGNPAYFYGVCLPDSLSFLGVSAIVFATQALLEIYTTFARNVMTRFANGIAKLRYREFALQQILSWRKNMDLQQTNGEIIYLVESSSEAVASYIKGFTINILPYLVSTIVASSYLFSINAVVGGDGTGGGGNHFYICTVARATR